MMLLFAQKYETKNVIIFYIHFRGCNLRLPHVSFDVCRFEIIKGTRIFARGEQHLLLPDVPTRTIILRT